jgi:outer membrane protein OmpA-like peptidoglycan-associated protein
VQRERILAYGRGELEPIADNTTPQGQQLNRRVEIRVRAVTQG